MEDEFVDAYELSKAFTMTSAQRMYALYQAVRYVVENRIEGDFVECGVWRGGSCMLMAHTLKAMGDTSRTLYLYDTFTGMTRPGEHDIRKRDRGASRSRAGKPRNARATTPGPTRPSTRCERTWPAPGTLRNVWSSSRARSRRHCRRPLRNAWRCYAWTRIGTNRPCTSWCTSIRVLRPAACSSSTTMAPFEGARRAVDEYLTEKRIGIFLNRVDATGRLAIKIE